mgnify:CR=1 FL=1
MPKPIFWTLVSLVLAVFVGCLYDVMNAKFKNPDHKLIWIAALFFTSGVAGFFYLLFRSRFVAGKEGE